MFAVCNKPLKADKELSPNNMELHILIIIVTKKLHAINSVVDVSELLQGKETGKRSPGPSWPEGRLALTLG